MWVYKILEKRTEAKAAGWLGKILGSGYDLELYVHVVLEPIFVVKKPHIECFGRRGNPRKTTISCSFRFMGNLPW
jgi:hypothetical protein